MTDREPVQKVATFFGNSVGLVKPKQPQHQPQYITRVFGRKAAQWMMTLYPLLCPRRQKKIREILTLWRTFPLSGHGRHQRKAI